MLEHSVCFAATIFRILKWYQAPHDIIILLQDSFPTRLYFKPTQINHSHIYKVKS
jgi:hypothetical protein